jgi:short-subunit dehydrogenase
MSRCALITGASTGIGYEFSKLLARDGYHVVLVARSEQRLAKVAQELRQSSGASVTILPKDLALPQAPQELYDQLQQQQVAVDILVNNAGFGSHGRFAEADLATQLSMMQVNMGALTHLTRLCLPGMIRRGWGRILNMSSTAAFQPGPLMAVYYASKAYVLSFSEALANEVRGTGVTVTVLCPGPTRTNFQNRAGVGDTLLVRSGVADAASVARAGYRGLMDGTPLVIPGFRNRLLAFLVRLTPRSVVTQVVRAIQERRAAA